MQVYSRTPFVRCVDTKNVMKAYRAFMIDLSYISTCISKFNVVIVIYMKRNKNNLYLLNPGEWDNLLVINTNIK